MNYKLSIVIPLFNSEPYIENCLSSILDSELPKEQYEIVIVNDGSTDNGPEIAKKYRLRYANILYLSQNNMGQSTARNYGIRECSGEYIWCVDSDDKIETGQLLKMYELLLTMSEIDILGVQLKLVTEEDVFLRTECLQATLSHNCLMKGREAILCGYNPSSVCALVIKKQLIERFNLFFREGMTHQDVELSLRLMAYADKVYFSDLKPYIYIRHAESTSQSLNVEKKTKYITDDILVMNSFSSLADEFEFSDAELTRRIRELIRRINFGMVLNLYYNKKRWSKLGIYSVVIDRMKETGYYPLKGNFGDWKKNILSKILNIFVS